MRVLVATILTLKSNYIFVTKPVFWESLRELAVKSENSEKKMKIIALSSDYCFAQNSKVFEVSDLRTVDSGNFTHFADFIVTHSQILKIQMDFSLSFALIYFIFLKLFEKIVAKDRQVPLPFRNTMPRFCHSPKSFKFIF